MKHEKVKSLFDFVVCKKTFLVAHIGCIDQDQLLLKQDFEELEFSKNDLEIPCTVKVVEELKLFKDLNVNECIACCQTNPDFVTCEVTFGGLLNEKRVVHYFCAINLPQVFQLDLYSS